MIGERVLIWRSYGGAPPAARAFVAARLLNAPLAGLRSDFAALDGRILSLGAGYGVIERYLTLVNPGVEVEAVDEDGGRVAAAGGAPRITLVEGDASAPPVSGPFDGALVVDLLHHLSYDDHSRLAANLARLLRPGATALIKDIARTPRLKHGFNALHDRMVAGEPAVQCREPEEMAAVFAEAGFAVDGVRRLNPRSPYPHYLLRLVRA